MVIKYLHKENPKPSQTALSMNEFKHSNSLPAIYRGSNLRCVNMSAVANLSYCSSQCQALSNSLLEEVCALPAGKEAATLYRLSNYEDFFQETL